MRAHSSYAFIVSLMCLHRKGLLRITRAYVSHKSKIGTTLREDLSRSTYKEIINSQLVLYIDGGCGLCKSYVSFMFSSLLPYFFTSIQFGIIYARRAGE